MSKKPLPFSHRLLVAFMAAASVTLIGGAVWMISTHRGEPVFVFFVGSMLGAIAAIIGSHTKKKP
jgi:hypothetical protein